MTYKHLINYHKWDKKDYKELFKSVNELIDIKNVSLQD